MVSLAELLLVDWLVLLWLELDGVELVLDWAGLVLGWAGLEEVELDEVCAATQRAPCSSTERTNSFRISV